MDGTKINDAYREGIRSYSSEKPYQNPYSPGTPEHNDFERGWSQALKRSSNPGPNPLETPFGDHLPEDKTEESRLSEAQRKVRDAYKNRK